MDETIKSNHLLIEAEVIRLFMKAGWDAKLTYGNNSKMQFDIALFNEGILKSFVEIRAIGIINKRKIENVLDCVDLMSRANNISTAYCFINNSLYMVQGKILTQLSNVPSPVELEDSKSGMNLSNYIKQTNWNRTELKVVGGATEIGTEVLAEVKRLREEMNSHGLIQKNNREEDKISNEAKHAELLERYNVIKGKLDSSEQAFRQQSIRNKWIGAFNIFIIIMMILLLKDLWGSGNENLGFFGVIASFVVNAIQFATTIVPVKIKS